MEVEEIQTQQGSKFPRIQVTASRNCQNGENEEEDETTARGNLGISTLGRFCGWPASRIVRVSRASGGKDRHSKVWTSKGLRDRRVRLSVHTAIQFYDLQDRLGYDQPSKAVEWLLKAAAKSIDELPSINTSFPVTPEDMGGSAEVADAGNHHSSNSETSNNGGGGQLSLSRSENRIKARERAKERRAEKELVQSSFTELLTGGTGQGSVPQMDYFPTMAQYNNHNNHQIHNQHQHQHEMQQHFSLLPDHMMPVAGTDLSFTMSSSSRGTLQSNSQQQTLLMPHQQHHNHFQRLSHLDGSSVPFFVGTAAPTSASIENHQHHNQFPTGLQLYYENVNGNGSHLDHKGKGKN